MTIKITTVASGLVVAALLAFGNIAVAKEHSSAKSELQPCKPHQLDAKDCHVHDKNAYLHMHPSDAKNAGPHATEEYRKLRRVHRQNLRD